MLKRIFKLLPEQRMIYYLKKTFKQLAYKAIYMILLTGLISGCSFSKTGIIKNVNTGHTATYKNLEPEAIMILVNGKELTDNEIPLGESFVVVNNKTKGLTQKEGNVSFGCSLVIKDEAGQELMNEADLFKGDDVINASPTTVLRCTVNTGKPMKAQTNYHITVTFWDKYGTGNIVNTVTVKMTGAS
ncbi:hypothetical protein BH11BAC4_BH11BAC4_24340 [soil metagenome]